MKRDYSEQLENCWPTIMQAWKAHAEKHPIIECDVVGQKVRAYSAGEYIDSLSERTRESARQTYTKTDKEGGIMVFVLDTKNEVLQSHCFLDVFKPAKKPNSLLPKAAKRKAR